MSDSLRQLPVPRAMYACPPPALPQVRLTHGNHKKLGAAAAEHSAFADYIARMAERESAKAILAPPRAKRQ